MVGRRITSYWYLFLCSHRKVDANMDIVPSSSLYNPSIAGIFVLVPAGSIGCVERGKGATGNWLKRPKIRGKYYLMARGDGAVVCFDRLGQSGDRDQDRDQDRDPLRASNIPGVRTGVTSICSCLV